MKSLAAFRRPSVLLAVCAALVDLGSTVSAQTVAYEGFNESSFIVDSVLSDAGYTPLPLTSNDVANGALLANPVDVFVVSRKTTFFGATQAYVDAIGDYVAAGGDIVTEWSGASLFFSSYAPDIRPPTQNTPQLGIFDGVFHGGESNGTGTPIRLLDPLHPTLAGLPNPFEEEGGTEFFYWIETDDPDLSILADFEGNGTPGFPLGEDLPCLAVGCKDGSVFVFGTWDWNDTLSQGALNARFFINAVEYADEFECGPACFVLDFETEDDFATPLVNGQHVDTEFGNLVTITSSGSNAGLAVFDSTVGGPNDPSQDLDLLVGSGNLLILQTENFPPDGNDVFPRPNDDEDGGTIVLAFASAVEAASLRLVDLDPTDGTSQVVLTDGSANRRTYTIPANWTGDIGGGAPGHRVLDLTTLAPQPGFGSQATATEEAGFDPLGVVEIAVHLDGSAGIDDVSVCAAEALVQRASVELRNGAGVNPVILTSTSLPVLGATWNVDLDCSALGPGLATLLVQRLPVSGTMTPFGEILVQGEILHRVTRRHPGAAASLGWNIPLDMSLVGFDAYAQGLCLARSAPSGPRTASVRAMLSNSVDLVLGF